MKYTKSIKKQVKGLNNKPLPNKEHKLLFFFFLSAKNRYYRLRESSQEYTRSGQKGPTKKKLKPKNQKNYLLSNQVRNSTTEFVLSSINPLAHAHKLVTKLALIFWSLVPSFSKLNLFLTRHRVQNRHGGAASQILLRFLPTAAPCQAKGCEAPTAGRPS